MAYSNNGGYGGYNRGFQGGQSRPQPRRDSDRPAPEILPEAVPADYIDRAEAVIKELLESRRNITTSKIRNLLSLVSGIYDAEKLRTAQELTPDSISRVGMMRIRTAYEAGRDDTVKTFVEKARLLQYMKGIGSSREDLIRFAHYMEALVAYHRFYGGREA